MSEFEPTPQPEIMRPTIDDVESYRRMQMKTWLDTYPNEAAGVSLDWVKERTDSFLTPEAIEQSKVRVRAILDDPDHMFLYIAKVGDESIGMVNSTRIDGHQRLEALYVDRTYQGKGVAQALMDTAMSHLDPREPVVLEVIEYNKRAQRFYEKYGFAIVPGSEHMYAQIMPSLKMIKPGETREI